MKNVTRLPGCVGVPPLRPVLSRELRNRLLITILLGVSAAASAWSQQASPVTTTNQQPSTKTEAEPSTASKQQVLASYGRLPLSFEVNRGQTDDHVKFVSRRPGFSLFLTPTEAVLALSKPLDVRNQKTMPGALPVTPQTVTSALRIKLVGANPAPSVDGLEELGTKSNYFIGNDPKKWQTNVPNYAKVKYVSVYPGVDLVYYGNEGKVEHDFIVSPGADAGTITMGFDKREKLRIDEHGDVVVKGKIGEVRLEKPTVYQEVGGVRQQVAGEYVSKGRNQIGFRVGKYDVTRTLVIDPVLSYSTYVSPTLASGGASPNGIAVDSVGSAYVTGWTNSSTFSPTAGAFQTTFPGTTTAFVVKLDATGSSVIYSTYLGGGGFGSVANGIAVDSAHSAYVSGTTYSTNFPTTLGAFQAAFAGSNSDAFVTKLTADGSGLVYSTYLGGCFPGAALSSSGIAVDSMDSAYVTGQVGCRSFPTTTGAYETSPDSCFVTKFNPTGSGLSYSTFFGDHYATFCNAIAVDSAGSAYITGYSEGTLPTTSGAFQPAQVPRPSAYSAFVTKFNPAGSGLVYSTYLTGNSNGDVGQGIAVDWAGYAYVTGWIGPPNTNFTASTSFPTTPGAFQTTFSGTANDAFVTKLNLDGTGLIYSTYLGDRISGLGGAGGSPAPQIAVDSVGSASVTGITSSPSFPTTPDAFQRAYNGIYSDAFVTKLTADGSGLIYSTYLGGHGQTQGLGIAVDLAGAIYVTGPAYSQDFPTTVGAVYPINNSSLTSSGFVSKFDFSQPSVSLSSDSLTFPDTAVGQSSAALTVKFSVSGSGALAFSNIMITGTNPGDFAITSDGCSGVTLAATTNSSCAELVGFTPTAGGTRTAELQFTYDGSGSPQAESLNGTGLSQASTTTTLTSSPNSAQFGQSVTFTATLSSTGAGTPTGSVAFYDGGATLLGSSVLTGTQATFTISSLSVGAHFITAVYGGNTNFNSSTSPAVTETVNKATASVTLNVANKTYDGTVAATITACTPTGVLMADTNNVSCTVGSATFADANVGNGKTVTATGLSLTGSAAGNYQLSGTTATTTANITALVVTPSITANNKVYDGTTVATIAGRSLSGVLSGDAANVNLNGGTATFSDANVGTGKPVTASGLSLTGSAAGNYQLSGTTTTTTANITALVLTPTITVASKSYDGTVAATITACTPTGVLMADTNNVSCTVGSATFADANVGNGKTVTATGLSLTGSAAGNYQLSGTTATTTASITALVVTPSITANNKVYDGTTVATIAGRSLSGVLSGDAANVNLSGGTATFSDANVGTGKPVTVTGLSLTGSAAGNYQLSGTTSTTTANITPLAVTPNITAANKVYDGTTVATITSQSVAGVLSSDTANVSLSGGTATFSDANVGMGKPVTVIGLSLTGSAMGNYQLSAASATTMANITPKSVTASITAASKSYDGTVAATITACTPTGVLMADTNNVRCTVGSATFADANVGNGKTVTATGLSLTGSAAGNYQLSATTATATANITGLVLTPSITANNKVYDGTTVATIAGRSLTGALSVDAANVSLSGGTATFSDANVGTGKPVTVTGLSLTGSAAGNYQLSIATATTTANITQAPLTVAANNATRPFGAANPTFGGTITGVQAGDNITATYTTAAGPTSPVGTYAITPVLSDPGGRLGNYTVSSTNGTLAVTQAATTTNVSVSPAPLTYGDYASFSATVIPTSAGGQALTGTVQFSLGGSPVGSAVISSGVATLSQVPVRSSLGSYPVMAAFSSPNANFAGSTGTTTPNVTVNLKNAFILYTGDTIAQVGTSLTLRTTVWDSAAAGYPGTPADTGPTAAIGDITKMWIEFDIYQAGTCDGGTPTTLYARVATTGTAGAGTATSMLNSSSEGSYCVVSKLVGGSSGGANSFYMASNAQPVGVDFYVNSGQFATGGGWVNDPTGSHGNFSFNARYNSTGSPKGQKVYTYRGSYNGVLADFIIKSNAITGLQFSGTTYPISATLQGKCNIQINRASDGSVLFSAGNYTFSATATDSGQNGPSGKQFSLIVYDASGVPYHTVPAGTPIQGGNVVIHW